MISRANRIALGLTALVLVSLFAWSIYWFVSHYERVSSSTRGDISPQARQNSLLAAQRLLAKLQIDSSSVSGRDRLYHLPSSDDVLLINQLNGNLSEQQWQAIVDWVYNGGHLITTPPAPYQSIEKEQTRPFYRHFGVRLQRTDGEFDEPGFGQLVKNLRDHARSPLSTVKLREFERPLLIEFSTTLQLITERDDQNLQLPESATRQLIQFESGEGKVTLLNNNNIFHNQRIADYDHALLFIWLIGNPDKVWLLYSSNMPSLINLLWSKMPLVVITALLLVSLLLWKMTCRSGRIHHQATTPRRNFVEHLEALGDVAWRHNKARGLYRQNHARITQADTQRDNNASKQTVGSDYRNEHQFIELTAQLSQINRQKRNRRTSHE